MSKFYPKFIVAIFAILFASGAYAQVSVTATAGTAGPTTYTTLKGAFDAINAGTHQGAVTVSITANTTETATAVLNASGGTASYTSVLVKPAASATPSISGAVTTALIELKGADNVTIDGSNTAGGTTKNLTIDNSSTGGETIRLSDGASNNVIKNTVIKGAINNSGVITISTSTAAEGNNNNLFQNNDITKSTTAPIAAIYNVGTAGKANTGNTYRQNRIFDFSAYGFLDGNGGAVGNSHNTLFELNEIYQTTAQAGALRAIMLNNATGITNMTISRNHIHDLTVSAAVAITGIDIYDVGSVTFSNNMINLSSSTASSIRAIYQEADAGAVVKIYYNTVLVSGTASGTSSSYAFIKNYLSTNDDIRNNIFANTRTSSGTGKQYAIANNNTGTISSNYNDLYSSGNANNVIGLVGTADAATLAAWQAATGQDANSVSVLPVFVSATDLHLNPASNSGLESKGVGVAGVTIDYDGETRSATPDLGADEMPATADVNGPAISYTTLSATCSGTNRTLTATINDATGVPTAGANVPRIYYRKAAGVWYSQPGTLTSGDGTSGTWNFTINNADMGGVTNGNTIEYYIIAQDLAGTPNISSNPSGATASNVNTVTAAPATPNSYVFGALMSGTFTVGTGGAYPTITAAVNAYNQGCLNGATVFSLIDATYSTSETFPIVISNTQGSATNTLTIKPAAGISPTITGASATTMFLLNGADYVTIDGSNTAGGTTRDLTITSTNAPVLIWIASENASNGAMNNTIKNLNLTGASGGATIASVLSGSGSTLGADAESPNSNNTITNNSMSRVQNGMYLRGNSTTLDANWSVTNNDIGSTVQADKNTFRGLLIGNATNFIVSGNRIVGINSGTTSTASVSGIQLALNASGGIISNNTIRDIKQLNATTSTASAGILLGSASTAAGVKVYNNMISDVASHGSTTTANGYGINVATGGGYDIDYNTVLMNTNQTLVGGKPAALNVAAAVTTAASINLRNNLFINTQTVGTDRYAIFSLAPNSVFGTIDYNDYYTTGPNLGFIGSNRADLAAIQAGFGGNANSISALPVFVSTTDLHLSATGNGAVEDKGTPVAGITTDFDNDTRSSTPDLGADELITVCVPAAITTQPTNQSACTGTAASFTVVATGTGLTYQWYKAAAPISGATSATYTINSVAAGDAANYHVVVTGTCGPVATSSTVTLTISGTGPVINTQPTAVTTCAGTAASFTVAATGTGVTYQWRKGGTNIGGATSATYNIASVAAADAGNYDVVVSSTGCGSVTSNAVALTVNPVTAIGTQPANQTVCAGANATFTVVATGAGLTYQWRKGGTNIAGATSATYTITGAAAAAAGSYDVVITGTCGNATSTAATLTVNAVTAIGTQPTAQTVCAGANATFTVAATGTNLTYQWRKGGTNIAGATSATYTITGAVAATHAGNYDVVVTGTCGNVTSNTVALTVNTCTSLPVIDTEISGVVLMPNIFESNTILRLNAKRSMKIDWMIMDAQGKVVMKFSRQAMAGQNDIPLMLKHLSSGTYYLRGQSDKGSTDVLRMVRL